MWNNISSMSTSKPKKGLPAFIFVEYGLRIGASSSSPNTEDWIFLSGTVARRQQKL